MAMPSGRAAIAAVSLCAALSLAPPVVGAAGAHPGKGRGGPQRSYLALGDSLAFGYQRAKFESLYPNENPAAFDTGYVDDIVAALRLRYPPLQVVNDGCPGETTESFIRGPCEYQLSFPLHHPYAAGPDSSQLADALAFLGEHRNFVNPITIDIGANDVLGVAGACSLRLTCVSEHASALIAHLSANLTLILTDVRQAAPHAKIAVLGLYDPFGEAALPGSNEITALVNETMAQTAAGAGALFVDPQPAFNPPGAEEEATICALTNMCSAGKVVLTGDIHPTDRGYAVLASLILAELRSVPPFGPPFFGE